MPQNQSRRANLHRMAAILSVATGASCLSPTSMTYDITTDIPCSEITSISVTVGTDDQTEQAEPVVVTQNCTPNGTVGAIGTYTVQPSKNKRALVWARFVAAVGKNVDLETDCTAKKNYQGGCVVARRRLTYIPGRELTVPVQLLAQCRDVGCETKSTCNIGGRCETSLLDASKCSASGVCTELSTEELSPSNSTVTVTPGSVAASGSASAEVTVTIRDANNAVMDVSSASVQVTAAPEGMGAWQGTGFVNQAPGVFTRTWLAGTKAGVVNFSGRVDGIILSSPPGRLTQLSGPVVAANSTISVLNPQVIANGTSSTSVVVTLVDAFGNAVNDPNHTVTITATDGQLIDTMKFDEASRSWRQGWVAPASLGVGTVTIQLATVDGQPITGRSTLIRLIAGPVSLDKSVLKVPQRVVTSASTTQIVTLDLRDATGNAVDVSDLTATGVVAPIAGVQRGVLGNGDKFTRTSPGVYSINLTSPASLTGCNGPPFCVDAVSAIVSAPGLNGGMPTAAGTAQRVQYGISPTLGTPAGTLTLVRSAAAAGPGASTLTATLQLQNTAMVPIQVGGDLARIKAATSFITPPLVITDNDNGSYTIAVPSPNLPVSGTLTVTVDNVPVTNGVKTISFYGAPDATQSTLTLSAGTLSGPGSVFAELKLRDANGTPIPELVLPQTSIRFSTTGQATVAGSPVGSITAGASVYTQQISRGPTPTIDFETSVVSAEGLVNGSWVSLGTPQTLTITPQNLAGVTINCSNIATYRNQNLYVDNGTLTIDSWVNGAQPVVGGCSGLGPAP